MTNLRQLLGSNIKKYRYACGLSQSKLAELADTATNYISAIEAGRRFPSVEVLEKIALALKIDTPELSSAENIQLFAVKTELEDRDVASFPRKELAKKIALLSQNMQIFFPYTIYETVSMGRYAYSHGFLKNFSAFDKDKTDKDKTDKEIIENILIKLDIWDIKDRMIDELSGGTLQRVFLAKTLAQTPDLILLDEPANHLDLKHQIELLTFLKSWVRENNKTLIGVFHDLNLARLFGDTAVVLNNGTIAASGKIDEVLNSEILSGVYGIDIRAFMRESFEKWN